MSSHEEVIKKFAERKVNSRINKVEWSGSNVFCNENTLFSYGSHFPLARYLGLLGTDHFFLKNGDKYSNSTSHHQSMTDQHCKGPVVSRNLLLSAGLKFDNIELKNILFFQQHSRQWIYKDTQTGRYYEEAHTRRDPGWGDVRPDPTSEWFTGAFEEKLVEREWTPPDVGYFVPTYKRKGRENRIISGTWYIPGGVVISQTRKRVLCCKSPDDGLFLKTLRKTPKSIREAFELAGVQYAPDQ